MQVNERARAILSQARARAEKGVDASGSDPLGRTQPAVSLQIRRLEELLGAKLLRFQGRVLKLTDAGVALGSYNFV